MVLSVTLFNACALHFIDISDKLNDKWALCLTDNNDYYISKSILKSSLIKSKNEYSDILWEYHILYSYSYGVPVLYFNASTENGRLVDLEDIWSMAHSLYEYQITANKWSTVTQSEHPYFRIPFYMIHPCKSEFMFDKILFDNCVNPLVTWFTTVASIIDLFLPVQYGQIMFHLSSENVKKINGAYI